MNIGEVVAAYTVIEPRELRNGVMSDIQAAAIAHQSCDVCQAGCTARRRIGFSCGHSVCEGCISRLATGSSVTCSQCRRVSTYSPTDESSHKAMLSLVKVRMSCDVETTLGNSEGHAKRCLPCMATIAASLLRETASSLATMRAKEDKIKRLSQANRRLQLRIDRVHETEDDLRETKVVVSNLRSKVEALYDKEDDLLAKIKSGYLREDNLHDQYVASKKRVALLLAKVRAEKKKAAESEERAKRVALVLAKVRAEMKKAAESEGKAKRAISLLVDQQEKQKAAEREERAKRAISLLEDKQEDGRAKKKAKKERDTLGDKQEGPRAKNKTKKNGDTARGGSAVEEGGEEGGGGGGGGSGSSRCERCSKRGLTCNRITLRANAPSCEECRSRRIGCSFNWP